MKEFMDGPHFFWKDPQTIVQVHVSTNFSAQKADLHQEEYDFTGSTLEVRGLNDGRIYHLNKYPREDHDVFSGVPRILAMGDVHGEYAHLVKFLQNNHVIDQELNWIFGSGHLVFCGDIFDRGDQVTECLWLIYHLEQQAENQGGKVHYLLGNHELMALENDNRYLSLKYKSICQDLGWNYADFFSKESLLGQWVRSKNLLVKINNHLFVHGGISPQLVEQQMPIPEINRLAREGLKDQLGISQELDLIFGSWGPLWYRGYLSSWMDYNLINLEELNQIRTFYDTDFIVFAHTQVDAITRLFNGKLYAIDVHLSKTNTQALLIEENNIFQLLHDNRKQKFTD
ncbi:MAG: metallophosphoesterase [Candidatus Cyclobacteriaceae bacterium M3_2C_046]